MNTPSWIRAAALIAAVGTTLLLLESVAWLAMPPPDAAPRIAQAAPAVRPR